ncbi:MAG TPA: hypothetical protein VKE70_02715 [Candidatus Solibacter sp.]|nr:hypothetical protein [Candidatus Solibacter sp.]
MKLTRRKLATLVTAVVAAPAVSPVVAQAQQPAGEDLMKTKRDAMQANAAALASVKVPMATEPAFQFKA